MNTRFLFLTVLLSGLLRPAAPAQAVIPADAVAAAARIQAATGVAGGFVVHLGAGDAHLTAALRRSASYQVQGLERDAAKVAAAREWLLGEKLQGDVTVDLWRPGPLPYIDNLVNLLVAEDLGDVPLDEVRRVLTPKGVAWIRQNGEWRKIEKPRPAEMDDWTHYYYDAKGNPTSHDRLVEPPERLQWVGSPRWSRHHDRMSSLSAAVSAGGRLFYVMDEGSRISILLPSHWTLTARDAFNGTVLWKREIPHWQSHLWPLKSGPTQLARRLVAEGERVFVTLSIDAPISQLDAATGATNRVYETTKGAEEILFADGVLYALVNPKAWSLEEFAPKFNTGDQRRVETEFNWDQQPRELQAVEAATGRLLWKREGKFAPLTLATDGTRLVFHDGDRIVGLDAVTGAERWATEPAAKRSLFEYNYGPRLLLHSNVVLYAGGDGAMKGFDRDLGKDLWSAPHNKSGYRSPEDLIVANGLVWNAPTISGNMSGEFVGRDPRTGAEQVRFPPDINAYWFHHRCYIAKATDRFIIPSRTGIEFVDLKAKHWDINHWVRSSCLYGTIPANGLTYAGPHNCACYPEAKLDGFNALASRSPTPHPVPPAEEERLERGPAYGSPAGPDPHALDWPTYRHDLARSGFTDQPLSEDLNKSWDLPLGGRLSPLTVADGLAFVAQIDAHTVHALDLATGRPRWHFVVGGRVDSPPTYWKGRVLFGSHDGSVYSVRASDGALVWRYRPSADRRHFAFEQLESVWPIPGSVLVQSNQVSFVAGRSMFLDGGLRFFRLDAETGRKLVEERYDDRDPETGGDLQERIKTLQMPVGLNDVLSSDGTWTYLRTQKIGPDGKRVDIGPVSGNAVEQGAAQQGEGAHLFSPTGFLDDSWFHRSYWVYGKSFAGGWGGYYQAGRFAPSGQILVFDDQKVYGYGREAQYLKWTTTLEHQIFSASRVAPKVAPQQASVAGGARHPGVVFPDAPKLDPAGKAVAVEAWVLPDGGSGVLVAQGGPGNGYALALRAGKPAFYIRGGGELGSVAAPEPLGDGWHHVTGVLATNRFLRLFVDGRLVATNTAPTLVTDRPAQPLEFGVDSGGSVGDYEDDFPFTGLLDEVVIYFREVDSAEVEARSLVADARSATNAILACTFDRSDARDDSTNGINGVLTGVDSGKGRSGAALWFHKLTPPTAVAASGTPNASANGAEGPNGTAAAPALAVGAGLAAAGTGPTEPPAPGSPPATPALAAAAAGSGLASVTGSGTNTGAAPLGNRRRAAAGAGGTNNAARTAQAGNSFVEYDWKAYTPVVTRGMSMAGTNVVVVGAPDVVDEEKAFERLKQKDATVQDDLREQDAALAGLRGAMVKIVNKGNGQVARDFAIDSPPVWDGVAVAQGRIFIVTTDGKIQCYGQPPKQPVLP